MPTFNPPNPREEMLQNSLHLLNMSRAAHAGTNGAADVQRSKQAGELVQCERPKTLADGLRGRMGDLTWPIVRDFVDDVISVSEEQIIDAMQLCFERMKVSPAVIPDCPCKPAAVSRCLEAPATLPGILLQPLCSSGHCITEETQQPHCFSQSW